MTHRDGWLSRERLAGRDPAVLGSSCALAVGAGAVSNNVALNLAHEGVGEVWFVDPDVVEPSNLTRSPGFTQQTASMGRPRYKARELSRSFLRWSYAENPVVRYATEPIQALGVGALAAADIVVAAVDNPVARAWVADACRLVGTPLVEVGFWNSSLHVTVWPNDAADAAAPCFRCLEPRDGAERAGCSLVAARLVGEGHAPATQSIAAATAALASETVLEALHGRVPLANHAWYLDVRSGQSRLLRVANDPDCPGVHRTLGEIVPLPVRAMESVTAVFEAISKEVDEPILHLPAPVVLSHPCELCGRRVRLSRPLWALKAPVACVPSCSNGRPMPSVGPEVVTTIRHDDETRHRRIRRLGLAPMAIFEVENGRTGEFRAYQLAGTFDDLFVTLRRPGDAGHNRPEATETPPLTAENAQGAST